MMDNGADGSPLPVWEFRLGLLNWRVEYFKILHRVRWRRAVWSGVS